MQSSRAKSLSSDCTSTARKASSNCVPCTLSFPWWHSVVISFSLQVSNLESNGGRRKRAAGQSRAVGRLSSCPCLRNVGMMLSQYSFSISIYLTLPVPLLLVPCVRNIHLTLMQWCFSGFLKHYPLRPWRPGVTTTLFPISVMGRCCLFSGCGLFLIC